MNDHANPWHIMAFDALSSGRSEAFMLVPCFVNGAPSAAIAYVQEQRKGLSVMPIFVGITPDMEIRCPEGDASDGDEGGGPKRDSVSDEFVSNKALTGPSIHNG